MLLFQPLPQLPESPYKPPPLLQTFLDSQSQLPSLQQTRPFHIRPMSSARGLVSPQDHPEDRLLPVSRTCPAICDTTSPSCVPGCLSSRTEQHRAAPSMKPSGVHSLPRWPPRGVRALLCRPSPQRQAQGRRLQDTSGQRPAAAGRSGSLLMHWVCLATTGPVLKLKHL